MSKRQPIEQRFREKVFPVPMSGCWLWMGALDKDGYGHICLGGGKSTPIGAHRAALLISGVAIPDGLQVLHRCDVPCCVNPDHLYLGTQAENIADMIGRGRRGDCGARLQTHCKRGHPLHGDNLRTRRGRRECLACLKIHSDKRRVRT